MRRYAPSVVLACALLVGSAARGEPSADGILKASGVRGGLVVHVGCGDGKLTAALRAGQSFLVHGLDADVDNVKRARKNIRSLGLYGPVSVGAFDGQHLPYVDNLVNLVVAEGLGRVPMAEVMRALAPAGVAYVKQGGGWEKTVKPRSGAIDEWTHFLHGPDNNAVAEDRVSGPPRHMQWLAGPAWTRHHHHDKKTHPAFRALVSAGGRVFYVVDEATAANISAPSRWRLVARDAFSGVLLWKKPLPAQSFPARLGQLWRSLITDGERVYTPFAPGGPLRSVGAVTGKEIRAYPETEGMEEAITADGRLYVVVKGSTMVALETETGRLLWRREPPDGAQVVPLTLAASGGRLFVKTDKSVLALSSDAGRELWRFDPGTKGKRKRLSWPREKLVAKEDVVLCSYGGGDPQLLNRDKWEYMGSHPKVNEYAGKLAALSARDGRVFWRAAYKPGLESYPGDVFVIGGLVWLGPDFAEGRDLRTGEIRKRNPVLERLWTEGHHHRCYPEKATSRYIMNSMRGVEFMDLEGDNHTRCNWVRGTCRLGVTPCNGLMYATPHSCGCYMEAKLYGFWALGPEREPYAGGEPAERLEKGPAYGRASGAGRVEAGPADWPTYRHDPARSGSASTQVDSDLGVLWRTDVGDRLSAPVVAAGRVVVSDVDSHRIVCLDARNGRELWSFAAGGRVDSPPTAHAGAVLAGCADGRVYCLRLSDGELVWRFLAAPREMNAVAFDQIESIWPVHGSVLVRGGVAYAAAGRSSYLDGGITLYGLDPATGKVRCTTRLESEHPHAPPPPSEAKRKEAYLRFAQNCTDYKTYLAPDRSDAFSMQGARTDVLVADGESVYLRQVRFDRQLSRQKKGLPHLFSVSRLLDGAEIHRSHWVLGTGDFTRTPVAYSWIAYGPGRGRGKALSVAYGLMLAFDERTVWGVRRNHLMRWKKSSRGMYVLFGQSRRDAPGAEKSLPDFRKVGVKLKWTAPLPIRPRAMVRAGGSLFVGGMTDRFDSKRPSAPSNAAFEGEKGGVLYVASCEDGRALGKAPLDSPPVWDGMAAANGRLYVSLKGGTVVCMGR